MGQKIYVTNNCRTELPFKILDEPVPIWSIIKKFMGKDITRCSWPVIMNEPLTSLQKMCEGITMNADLFELAANTDDPFKRITIAYIAFYSGFSTLVYRKRKPFNPMLGETYELVTEKFKFVSEKVQHSPQQISVWQLDGQDYSANGYYMPELKFKFNGGKGLCEITQYGPFDIYFKKYDEHISFAKPNVLLKNLVFGGMFIDLEGEVCAVNHKTGDKVIGTFIPKSGNRESKLEGKSYDAKNNPKWEILGSWQTQI